MKPTYKFWLAGAVSLCYLAMAAHVQAQVTSDGTLSTEVNTLDTRNFTVTGGNRVGDNLFHSFSEFSVPNGGSAAFVNNLDVQNIISRVTGGSISNIEGLIKAEGSANLFLINSNGIIFGPGAKLEIGGSFLASTANRLNFADGTFFSATELQAQPLLTVSVPIGLRFGNSTGIIQNQSQATRLNPTTGRQVTYGLEVQPGKTLALVGGNVLLDGGNLSALGGRIEVGSVSGPSFVSLTPVLAGWSLGYESVQNFQDIQLSQQAFITTSGESSGDVQLRGRQIAITDGSGVVAINRGVNSGGNLVLKASESVEVTGSELTTSNISTGTAGDIQIETRQLIVSGSYVDASSSGDGRGGNLTVNALELVEVNGGGRLSTQAFAGGDAGDLTIITDRLIVSDGAEVSVSSGILEDAGDLSTKIGNAGNLSVTARSINLEEQGKLTATINELGKGGGNITLNNLNLLLLRNGEISTSALGSGNGGNITINADASVAIEESKITATAVEGRGGNIRITTQGLFLSPDSRIDASSDQGVDGLVEINRPEADPRTELIALPAQVVDVSGLVAEACPAGGGNLARGSKFVVTGRGGLPPTPSEVTRSDAVLVDLGTPVQSTEDRLIAAIPTNNSTISESAPLVEANGWMVGNKGEVVLTASASNTNPEISRATPTSCRS